MKRIVITGMGCISALGNNVNDFQRQLFRGTNGVADISLFDCNNFQAKVAAEIKNYIPKNHFSDKQLPFLDRFAQFALLSAREAVKQANLSFAGELSESSAVLFGTGVGGQETQDQGFHRLYAENKKQLHPFTVPKLIPSSAASHISIEFNITGPVIGTTSACASSGHAIIIACMMLQSNQANVVIAGGAEAPISFGCVKAWESMRVLAKDCCRPFSVNRGGTVLGEGAATLVLETLEHAEARGATIIAEVLGYGMSSDAGHIVQPSVAGPTKAMVNALQHASLLPGDVQYINAHGSGTAQNDPTETEAIHNVFGRHAASLAISSTKSMHGHTLGAATALESIVTILALQNQKAPATINYLGRDPKCDLDYIPNEARAMLIQNALCNSFAFGGLNVSLAFSRPSELVC